MRSQQTTGSISGPNSQRLGPQIKHHQCTIAEAVHAVGVGVHSGQRVRISLRPAEANTGILFYRMDRAPLVGIPASALNVTDTTLSTSIMHQGVQVDTVEHLMSALWGLGIDNVRIELWGIEVPIMDGSAAPYVRLIENAGIKQLDAVKQYIRVNREIRVSQGNASAVLTPYNGFKAEYTFVADHPVYNQYPKYACIDFEETCYLRDVSQARSFGLLSELPQAQAINKCLGSSLVNAVGVTEDTIMNPEGLRYQDEFVKHKILDAIGDLFLLGLPLLGAFSGYMSGHSLNNRLARALLRCHDAWDLIQISEPLISNTQKDPAEFQILG